jgi:GT2 family glycosyltransferase
MKFDLTISIVLYRSNLKLMEEVIDSVYKTTLNFKLYLVDNSPDDSLRILKRDDRCEYIYPGNNLGFGRAHNLAMREALVESTYHLVLNPDVYFGEGILESIFRYMEHHPSVGQVMPRIMYPDGRTQHLCKLLPSPMDLFLRRFFPWFPGAAERNRQYELLDSGYDKIMNIPYLSGCFMFFRTSVLQEVGLFDERIFMYIEDADLTRRVHQRYQTNYFPEVSIYHHYHKGSYKNIKLMLYNVHGAFVYFMKWGWFFDRERKKINREVLRKYVVAS